MDIKTLLIEDAASAGNARLVDEIIKLPPDHPDLLAVGDRILNGDDDGDEYRDILHDRIGKWNGEGAEAFLSGLLRKFDNL